MLDVKKVLSGIEGLAITDAQSKALADAIASGIKADVDAAVADVAKQRDDASANAARVKSEREKLATEVSTLSAEIAKIKEAKMTPDDKTAQQIANMQKSLEQVQAELTSEREKAKSLTREHAIDTMMQGLKINTDVIGNDAARILLSQAVSHVDDLGAPTNKAVVDAALAQFRSSNKGLLAADVKGGVSSTPGDVRASGADTVIDGAALLKMATSGDKKSAQASLDAAVAADKAGSLTIQ